MVPVKLVPAYKDYIWGGNLLKTKYNKKTDLEIVAESWELSCHKDGQSVIADGEYKGMTLSEYIKSGGSSILGTRCRDFEEFPIMIKLIDAKENLSVQVHPDDDYAGRVEGGYGKTEIWYVLECEENASLIYGFKHAVTKSEYEERIRENTLLEVVNSVPVKKGDVFFIEAGTLHAIGKGIVLAEVQQNSNLTYRVYDYGRLGPDNKPRQLHIDKAIDVTVLDKPSRPVGAQGVCEVKNGYSTTLLAECEYFHVERIDVTQRAVLDADDESFLSILCLDGDAAITFESSRMSIAKGDSVFIPAGMGTFVVERACSLLLTKV